MRRRVVVVLLALMAALNQAGIGQAIPIDSAGDGGVSPVRDVTGAFRIKVDGRTCDAGPVLLKHERIYLQLRGLAACLGASVQWFPGGGTAVVGLNGFGKPPVTATFRPLNGDPIMEMRESGSLIPTRFNMGEEAPFVWLDNRTYLPFRWLTDAADYKTVFTPGQPNEVNVYRQQRAIPNDGYQILPAHVIVVTEAKEPFRLAAEPQSGWPFSPATLRALRAGFLQANWAIRSIRKDPEARVELNFDPNKVRIDVRAVNTSSMHVTHYGTHFVRWFDSETEVDAYQTDLDISNLWQGFWSSVWTGAGSGVLTWLVGGSTLVSTAATVPAGAVTFAYWLVENRVDARFVQGCRTESANDDNNPKHRQGEPIFGILYGVQGTHCIPFYSDQALDARGNYF